MSEVNSEVNTLFNIEQRFDEQTRQVTRAEAVARLRSITGTPWVHQGRDPRAGGVDCLGMLVWLARSLGYRVVKDRTDYPLSPPGEELRAGLRSNLHVISFEERLEADVVLIRFPQDKVARHLGVIAQGPYEEMLIHAFNNRRSIRRVIEEPIERWTDYVQETYRFPHFIQ